ncbi:S8 family serine peptidase [Helicobacter mesocricetorum]|uniref:S8 family serine peptidase n=1 Tax=Helicobacter mesocricetorum TaxID=87012 RepID=UPI000CF03802|nr:S8 family serine peptidase [Helicobacter mesocricetorum]
MRVLIILWIFSFVKILADNFVNSKALDLINAQDVYKQGITGKGVNVGVLDSAMNKNHISLKNKIGGEAIFDASSNGHGSHVGGIIAGEKLDSSKPHGVAYDAMLYSGQIFGNGVPPSFTDFFTKNKVKIINNSWNDTFYPFVGIQDLSFDRGFFYDTQPSEFFLQNVYQFSYAEEISNLAQKNQTLLVFASGNEGIISSGLNSILPSFDENLRSFINVGSLNADGVFRDGDKLRVTAKGVSDFSNGFLKSENYSLMAFGGQINSVDARGVNDYFKQSGTSMAAPMVSGAAALVAQKFPFLNGKQIADILLSTANKDYQAPKLVVKRSTNVNNPNNVYYTIIYIDNAPPANNNTQQIKQDLIAEGYTGTEADNILNNLITKVIPANYEAVVRLSREAVFGQGILDVKKALGGVATLDANRLNDRDKARLKNNTEELYYQVDTQGANAEFSNNIAQKQWDDSLHYSGAKNLPTNMQNLNVGFIKKGKGELTFSGVNTYRGSTIIQDGALRLKRSAKSGGELVNSNVFVEKGGKLSGNGIIHKDLMNEGVVRVGNEDLSNLEVRGTYRQVGVDSLLQLDFGRDKNSLLLAGSYDIQSGVLEYIPLQQFFYSGEYVKIDLGKLGDSIDKFTEVRVKENNAMSFEAVLDADKTTINAANKGIIVAPALKGDAYNTANSNVGSVLREIRNDRNLSEGYKNYFALLDNSPNSVQILESIEGKSYLDNAASDANNSLSTTQHNMLFALNPSAATSLAFNLHQEPQYLASVSSDSLTNTWNFLELNNKNLFWYLSPSYKKINGDGNKGYSSGVDLAIGKDINSDLRATLNLKYSNTDLEFNQSDFDSKNANFGVNTIYNLGAFKLLGGSFFNYGFNKMNRNVLGSTSSINAKYNSLSVALQMGVAKDWELQDFTLTPLVYLNYAYYHQESFKESGELWSKEYQPINHHTTSLASGLNLSYSFEDTFLKHTFSGFGIYEYRLNGKTLKNKARFNDFITQSFTQQNELNKYLISLGVSYYLTYGDYFFNLSLVDELARRENNMKLSGSFGMRF